MCDVHTRGRYAAYYMQRARKRIRYDVGTPRARSGLKEGGPRRQVRANREAPRAISLSSPLFLYLSLSLILSPTRSPFSLSRSRTLFLFLVSSLLRLRVYSVLSSLLPSRSAFLTLFSIVSLSPSADPLRLRSPLLTYLNETRPRRCEYGIFLAFGRDDST